MQRSDRPTLLVGRLDRTSRERILREGLPPGTQLEVFDDGPSAMGWLEKGEPHAVLVHLTAEQSERFILGVRVQPQLSRVPVLALVEEVGDLSFAQAFAWGADDAVAVTDAAGLRRRLHSIPSDLPHAVPPNRGKVLLAHSDQRTRVLMGRVLRNAGFDVRFATQASEVEGGASEDGIKLVVADGELEGGQVTEVLARVRAAGLGIPWILMVPPKSVASVAESVAGQPQVVVHDSYAPHENLHFVANEMMSGSFHEQRESPRLLFNTLVAFRAAGRDTDRNGYTYNISAQGLFIRTLDPLMRDEDVWIELTPPRTDRRVRVEGQVAWTRMLGPWAGATVPPGFGVKITGGSSRDLARFSDGYLAFSRDITGTN